MTGEVPKYALLDDREVALLEVISHISSTSTICVFKDAAGARRFVSIEEWQAAAESFARFAASKGLVTSESSSRDKLLLFRSLFRGRDDVYAHGYAKRDGGIGYSPTCANERTERCPRWTRANPGMRCATCPMREFVPINDQAIIEHFKGRRDDLRDVMGLYVLTPDCKTWALVADFDKEGWQGETTLYRDACRSFGLVPAVERSRSGNGSHVWLFFEEAVDAELARSLGCSLITHAMSRSAGMSFESYDRLFPTQSTIPEGGFGNLIALPFQGRAHGRSNSVFVDDEFEPYPDQWRFLSTISKVSLQQARDIVDSVNDGPLGRLAFSAHSARRVGEVRGPYEMQGPSEKQGLYEMREPSVMREPSEMQGPHERQAPREAREHREAKEPHEAQEPSEAKRPLSCGTPPIRRADVTPAGFPETVGVTKANMLYVSKRGLSNKAQNLVRRLAAFGNPEFYRAQAMHQSVYGKQRIVWCGEEDERFILLPRGCEQRLVDLAGEQGFTCAFDDRRNDGTPIGVEFSGVLRDRQQKAADALLRYENGILMAPTGFGKTVVGAYLIGRLKMRTLVIVPKTSLIDQWRERLGQFLDIEDDRPPLLTKTGKPSKRKRPVIGQIGGGKSAPSGLVDIATFQSLSTKDDLGIPHAKALVEDYGLVICDECHYGAAPNLELVMKSVKARRVYGLSATPRRPDGLERIIYLHCGPVRHKIDPREQAVEQGFRRVLRPRFTRIRLASLEPGATFNQVVEALYAHAARNALIAEDAVGAVGSGRTPLVITSRKEHADELARLLGEAGVETHVLTGEGTAREKRERIERVRNATNAHYAIVATGSYIGEGFDLPQLDTLLLAAPYSFEGVITQYSGRLHREREGKDDVIVYDYVDASVPMLERMYKKRLRTYAKLGYEVEGVGETQGPGARIVTANGWHAEFVSDLSHAGRSVVISAPYANPRLVESLMPGVAGAIARGIGVKVILRRPRSEKSIAVQAGVTTMLADAGCEVVVCDAPLTGIAVIDSKTAWYGTLPLLAHAKADDCSLRVESAEVAADLEKALESGAS